MRSAWAIVRHVLLAAVLLAVVGVVRPVLGHGYLVRAIPENGAVFERPPARLQYWFSEGLEPAFSSLTVRDAQGTIIASGGVSPDNNALLSARMPSTLADGTYVADMRLAFASDGHVIADRRVFFIGQAAQGYSPDGAINRADPLEVIWRALSLSGAIVLFGQFTLYSGVLVPAWGNPAYPAGLLPPRVMRRLYWVAGIALAIAFVGTLLSLLQQSMAFFNTDLPGVFRQDAWNIVRTGTRFGEIWNGRMILLALVAAMLGLSLYFREEQPAAVRPFWSASAWAMALVLGTFSASSHAAGSPVLTWIGVFNDWLHILAVGLWAGGLGALILLMPPALAPYQGEARRQALLAVLRRFSRLATACVWIVIATGLYSAANWIYRPEDLAQTSFGGALILKLLLVASLIGVGLLHHMAVSPERFARWSARLPAPDHLLSTLRLEAILALVVVSSVGLLSATPVPVPYFVQDGAPSPTATTNLDDFTFAVTLSPGGPGINTVDVLVNRANEPVTDLTLALRLADPSRDWRGRWEPVEDSGDGLYATVSADVDRPGNWWSLLDVTLPDGLTRRLAFQWDIRAESAVEKSRPPTTQHVITLMMVLVTLGWAAYPAGRRLYHRLDLSPAAITIAIGAVVATLFFSALGFFVLQDTQARTAATLNPPPRILNAVLPDESSLRRGEALFRARCADWSGDALASLIERMPRLRDEELFAATRDGWRDLSACAGTLPDAGRWDLVNYIRSLESGGTRVSLVR